jgi:kynurenine formamidase
MLIDITLKITPKMVKDAEGNENKALVGHLGTHFDVMDKEFPLEYTERKAIVFDVSKVMNRDIEVSDIDLNKIEKHMFVAFYTGFIEKEEYGSDNYFKNHPQLSDALIDALLEKEISIIGIDFAGVRRGKEHIPKDRYCADRGLFIVENLCNLNEILSNGARFIASTYPMNYIGVTGLPCRVVAKI